MKKFSIFKREQPQMPLPDFKDNWLEDSFLKNIRNGVSSLEQGKEIVIYDDGRGYELACEIKRQFVLEYQKQLAEKIIISNGSTINICFKK